MELRPAGRRFARYDCEEFLLQLNKAKYIKLTPIYTNHKDDFGQK